MNAISMHIMITWNGAVPWGRKSLTSKAVHTRQRRREGRRGKRVSCHRNVYIYHHRVVVTQCKDHVFHSVETLLAGGYEEAKLRSSGGAKDVLDSEIMGISNSTTL